MRGGRGRWTAAVGLTRALAVEFAPVGVQVNAVAPGYFTSDMNVTLRADDVLYAKVLRQIPARRFGSPEELGSLMVYLVSAASDFMTGETIVVDGGQSAH